MAVGVVDEAQNILHRGTEPTFGRDLSQLLGELETELREGLEACPGVEAIGLGIPSTIDRERGVAISSVNLPIVDVPIRELMAEKFEVPVFIDNDANCAALAEQRFGAAEGAANALMLTIGTGIGGGVIVDGQIYRGSKGSAAELGHVVIDLNGPPCQGNCPNHGCVEVLASGTALGLEGRAVAEAHPDSALGQALGTGETIDGRRVTDAAFDGDQAAIDALATIGRHLGVALSSLANIFAPDVIVIGGGVSRAGELLIGPARQEMGERALPPMNETRVAIAGLGPDAGMIGAAVMALDEVQVSR
jgi:glucokinase